MLAEPLHYSWWALLAITASSLLLYPLFSCRGCFDCWLVCCANSTANLFMLSTCPPNYCCFFHFSPPIGVSLILSPTQLVDAVAINAGELFIFQITFLFAVIVIIFHPAQCQSPHPLQLNAIIGSHPAAMYNNCHNYVAMTIELASPANEAFGCCVASLPSVYYKWMIVVITPCAVKQLLQPTSLSLSCNAAIDSVLPCWVSLPVAPTSGFYTGKLLSESCCLLSRRIAFAHSLFLLCCCW